MSYAEEAIYMAKVKLQWAEDGFRKSARNLKESIDRSTNDEIIEMAKALSLDKIILDEAEEYYNYIIERYGKEVEQ